MNLTLPLKSGSDESIDYTTIDNLKFSKTMSGTERAQHIASVFSDHYGKQKCNFKISKAYSEYYVKLDHSIYVCFRGYKHIVVCIVEQNSIANFGPNGRSRASNRNALFEETNNLFPFRDVLTCVRSLYNIAEEKDRERKVEEAEADFKQLQLEGILTVDLGLRLNNMERMESRRWTNKNVPKISYSFGREGWYRSTFELKENSNLDICLGGYMHLDDITIDDAESIIKPIEKWFISKRN